MGTFVNAVVIDVRALKQHVDLSFIHHRPDLAVCSCHPLVWFRIYRVCVNAQGRCNGNGWQKTNSIFRTASRGHCLQKSVFLWTYGIFCCLWWFFVTALVPNAFYVYFLLCFKMQSFGIDEHVSLLDGSIRLGQQQALDRKCCRTVDEGECYYALRENQNSIYAKAV